MEPLRPTSVTSTAGDDPVKESDAAHFAADVIEASATTPVIVDFWAPWCGPCKQLTPILEKLVRAARGAVRLVKINVDENQEIAAQLRVQSIPAVFAFKDGKAVDGFMGALPEAQIRRFIDRLGGNAAAIKAEQTIAEAEDRYGRGDIGDAAALYVSVLQEDRENTAAIAGLAKCQIAEGDIENAEKTLALVPPGKEADAPVKGARAALEIARNPVDEDEIAELTAKLDKAPGDHEARLALAVALNGAGAREEALDHILKIIEADRDWNEGAARRQLLTFFDAWGPADALTVSGRRRLSSILFA